MSRNDYRSMPRPGASSRGMVAHGEPAARAEHQRWIAHVVGQQQRAERAFLRDEARAGGVGHGQPGAGQAAGLTDLRADDHAEAGGAGRVDHRERPPDATHLRDPQVDDPARRRRRQRGHRGGGRHALVDDDRRVQPIGQSRQISRCVRPAPTAPRRQRAGSPARRGRPPHRRPRATGCWHRPGRGPGPRVRASAASLARSRAEIARELHLEVAQAHRVVARGQLRQRPPAPCPRARPSSGRRRRAASARPGARAARRRCGPRHRAARARPRTRRPGCGRSPRCAPRSRRRSASRDCTCSSEGAMRGEEGQGRVDRFAR